MGLDGISINQLRTVVEPNTQVYKSLSRSSEYETKAVDGLSHGQKVDPDKRQKQENKNNFKNSENQNQEENDEVEINKKTIKYDLTQTNKYRIDTDEENSILIVENDTNKILQKITSNELSKFVHHLCMSNGSIVNKRL